MFVLFVSTVPVRDCILSSICVVRLACKSSTRVCITVLSLSTRADNVIFTLLKSSDNALDTVCSWVVSNCMSAVSSQLSLLFLTKESRESNLEPSAATSRVLMFPSTVKPPCTLNVLVMVVSVKCRVL